jgi:hypothetical protein
MRSSHSACVAALVAASDVICIKVVARDPHSTCSARAILVLCVCFGRASVHLSSFERLGERNLL